MDIMKVLAELRQERQRIEDAIMTLERLASGHGRGPGRPPAWLAEERAKPVARRRARQKKALISIDHVSRAG